MTVGNCTILEGLLKRPFGRKNNIIRDRLKTRGWGMVLEEMIMKSLSPAHKTPIQAMIH